MTQEPLSAAAIRPEDFSGLSLLEPLPPPSIRSGNAASTLDSALCFHCGAACRADSWTNADKSFCCQGCLTVFELLTANGLADFYKLDPAAGVRVNSNPQEQETHFNYLDTPSVREKIVDFSDDRLTRVTLRLPAIHCVACVWLLENLFRLKEGIGESKVFFLRKEAAISFRTDKVRLSEVVSLLASLGYPPDLKFSDLGARTPFRAARRLWMQLGIAGFAFGNTMLLSISNYLGLDSLHGPAFQKLFGYISLVFSIPVVVYSAADYWRSAWVSLQQRLLNIDVPIAAGILALFLQSAAEVLSGRGEGYFDSLAGLLFFLLCGKLFQQKSFDRLAFDRDFTSFFPLSITRRTPAGREERVSLSQLHPGDRLVIRNGELIPADARLVNGPASIDYSFVTGESEPVPKQPNDHLYAGGRQLGQSIEVEMVKDVSQGYLTSLWNQDAFAKDQTQTFQTLTNRYSQRFTKIILAIALGAAIFWAASGDASLAVKSFVSVLIVACPCALALAAPFALGTAQRVLGRRNVFLKNPTVVEALAQVDSVVFDKTGTLTAAGAGSIAFHGPPLTLEEQRLLASAARHSTHPLAVRIAQALPPPDLAEPVRSFTETPGCGMECSAGGAELWIGSGTWLASRGIPVPAIPSDPPAPGSVVHIALNRIYRGCFTLRTAMRAETEPLLRRLGGQCELALLSGDNAKDRERFRQVFHASAEVRFEQNPLQKLQFVRQLQDTGKTVMMVGDGLNDAGALKQSNVGVAVVENMSAFSPASDIIMAAAMIPKLDRVLDFSKNAVKIVRLSFLISTLYNAAGVAIAAAGLLSPIVCAILMPLSSITVVGFACGATHWMGRGLNPSKEDL